MAVAGRIECMILLFALLISLFPVSQASKKTNSFARKEDVPYIKCQVCEKIASQLLQQVNKKQKQISPKEISEFQIIEIAENVCNLKGEEADWILRIDIVERGDMLELVEQDAEGECNSECKTIERACQEVMGYHDTDVAEFLFKSKPQLDLLAKFLCNDISKACTAKPPPVPKDRISGEPFIPKPSKDAEMDKILRSMQGMPGAPNMKMYSKDDLLNMKNFGDEDGDEDDENEDAFPSNLGKVLREKQPPKVDWKQQIIRGLKNVGVEVKKHVNKASRRIRKWWRRKKTAYIAKKAEL